MKKIVFILATIVFLLAVNFSYSNTIKVYMRYFDIGLNYEKMVLPDSLIVQNLQTGDIECISGSEIFIKSPTEVLYDTLYDSPILVSFDSRIGELVIKSNYMEQKKIKCQIFDYFGRVIFSNEFPFVYPNEYTINMNNYSIGIYFIRFLSSEGDYLISFIKNLNHALFNNIPRKTIIKDSHKFKITAILKKLDRIFVQILPSSGIYKYNPDKPKDTLYIDSELETRWFNYEANIQLDSIYFEYDYKHDSYYWDKNGSKFNSDTSHHEGYVTTTIKYKRYEKADIEAYWSGGYYWSCCDNVIIYQPSNWDNVNIYNVLTSQSSNSDDRNWLCTKQYLRYDIDIKNNKIKSLDLLNWKNHLWHKYTNQEGTNSRIDLLTIADVDYTVEDDTIVVELSGDALFNSIKSYKINTREYRDVQSRSDQKRWTDNYYHFYTFMKSDPATRIKIKIWKVK